MRCIRMINKNTRARETCPSWHLVPWHTLVFFGKTLKIQVLKWEISFCYSKLILVFNESRFQQYQSVKLPFFNSIFVEDRCGTLIIEECLLRSTKLTTSTHQVWLQNSERKESRKKTKRESSHIILSFTHCLTHLFPSLFVSSSYFFLALIKLSG